MFIFIPLYDVNKEAKFIGNFEKDLVYGSGKIFYKDGKIYKGEWKDFNKHGQGTLYSQDEVVLKSGRWVNDQFIDKK